MFKLKKRDQSKKGSNDQKKHTLIDLELKLKVSTRSRNNRDESESSSCEAESVCDDDK